MVGTVYGMGLEGMGLEGMGLEGMWLEGMMRLMVGHVSETELIGLRLMIGVVSDPGQVGLRLMVGTVSRAELWLMIGATAVSGASGLVSRSRSWGTFFTRHFSLIIRFRCPGKFRFLDLYTSGRRLANRRFLLTNRLQWCRLLRIAFSLIMRAIEQKYSRYKPCKEAHVLRKKIFKSHSEKRQI